VVLVDNDSTPLCTVTAPLWAPYIQTSQASEFGAYCFASQFAEGLSVGYKNCANVVLQHSLSRQEQLSYRRKYSGVFLFTQGSCMSDLLKVKAHVSDTDADVQTDPFRLFCKAGNDAADRGAKVAALSHPAPSPQDVATLNEHMFVSRMVCMLAVHILPMWPKCDLDGVDRAPHVPVHAPPKAAHKWIWARGFWQCCKCLKVSRAQALPALGACSETSRLDAARLREQGHGCITLKTSEGVNCTICLRCKGLSSLKARWLKSECRPPSRSTLASWKRICRGMHPTKADVTVETGPLAFL
jgi:hypothetical protein